METVTSTTTSAAATFDGQTLTTCTGKTFTVESCAYSWHGTSHSPEKRARTFLQFTADDMNDYQQEAKRLHPESAQELVPVYVDKMHQLAQAELAARKNCFSAFIAGPSNFNTRRAEKANRSLEKRQEERITYANKARKRLQPKRDDGPIMANDPEALTKLRTKLEQQENSLELMKAVNAAMRKFRSLRKKGQQVEFMVVLQSIYPEPINDKLKATLEREAETMQPFTFQLANTRQRIEQIKGRILQIERLEQASDIEREYVLPDGSPLTYREDTGAARVQLLFEGKPDAATRATLKKYAFRWAPSQNAWQRQLTANGKHAAQSAIAALNATPK